MTVTIGADPEVFLSDKRTGTVVPACGLIGGTKEKPLAIDGMAEGFAVQEDNVMLEYNIPPTAYYDEFTYSIRTMLGRCNEMVSKKNPNYTIDVGSERLFPRELLQTPQAMMFGCSPDFNAYENGAPWDPVDPEDLEEDVGAWRFAGGHIHVGFSEPTKVNAPDFVQAAFADLFLGLPATSADKQGKRRELYGQPGRFRPTKYGFEYRTLSNFWVFADETCSEMGRRALNLGSFLETSSEDRLRHCFREIPWANVRDAIIKNDEGQAADVLAFATGDLRLSEAA